MRAFVRFLVFLLVLAVLVGGVAWFWAGRSAGPTITIRQPGKFVGQNSSL
jgi:membrane protein DedA with SNARE-associated domain